MNFKESIIKLLGERQMKQSDLCKMTGIPSSLMSNYTTGKKTPTLNNAIIMANALNITLDELAGRVVCVK